MKTGIKEVKKEFITNDKNIVCIVYIKQKNYNIKVVAKGISRCSDEDEFDPEFGRRLAEAKALKKGYCKIAKIMLNKIQKLEELSDNLYDFMINVITAEGSEADRLEYLINNKFGKQ
jgi:hypothetical protein